MFFLCTCGRLAAFLRKRDIRTVRLAKDDSVIKKYRRKKMKLNDEIKGYWEGEADIYSRAIWKELTGPQCEEWKKIILKYAPKKEPMEIDRKSTRLNSSHVSISYAVFCLKKKK